MRSDTLSSRPHCALTSSSTSKLIDGGLPEVGWNRIGVTYFNERSPLMTSESYLTDTIAVLLSGMAAERLFFGEHSMASGGNVTSDLNRATDLATMMERCFAFGDNLVTDIGVGERPMENLRRG